MSAVYRTPPAIANASLDPCRQSVTPRFWVIPSSRQVQDQATIDLPPHWLNWPEITRRRGRQDGLDTPELGQLTDDAECRRCQRQPRRTSAQELVGLEPAAVDRLLLVVVGLRIEDFGH
jgi:hypothetical protein